MYIDIYIFLYEPSRSVVVLTKLSLSQNTTICIFNNVNFAAYFGYSNNHQADNSVLGHDMFSATVWDPNCLHLLCRISDI